MQDETIKETTAEEIAQQYEGRNEESVQDPDYVEQDLGEEE